MCYLNGMGLPRLLCAALAAGAVMPACSRPVAPAPASAASLASDPPAGPAALAVSAAEAVAAPAPAPLTASAGKLTMAEARRYMLKLINRDRASQGLGPVVLEEGPAQRGGQGHAEDMAKNGYLGHWGTDGSVPEQRFTEAGGTDMVLENASCFTDEKKRTLDRSPGIDPRNVEQTEDMFFHEVPPHDGHRKNILKPWHRSVGIGVAQPVATATEIPVPCFSQEFVDDYGTYAAVPARVHVGDTLHVEGTIAAPATFAGVGLARTDAPRPVPVSELNKRRSYPVPTPYQMYWPPGFQTPIPVKVSGAQFSIDVPVSDGGKAGLYEVSVWATVPGTADLTMVSLRTFTAR
jgi:uncharacterized protein YkwD